MKPKLKAKAKIKKPAKKLAKKQLLLPAPHIIYKPFAFLPDLKVHNGIIYFNIADIPTTMAERFLQWIRLIPTLRSDWESEGLNELPDQGALYYYEDLQAWFHELNKEFV